MIDIKDKFGTSNICLRTRWSGVRIPPGAPFSLLNSVTCNGIANLIFSHCPIDRVLSYKRKEEPPKKEHFSDQGRSTPYPLITLGLS